MFLGHAGYRRTTIISITLGIFLIGLALPKLSFDQEYVFYVIAGLLVTGVFITRRRKKKLFIMLFMILALAGGYWRGIQTMQKVYAYHNYIGREVTMRVTAREDAVYSERKQLVFSASNISLIEPDNKQMIGNVEVEGFGVPMVYRGDTVEVTGRLFNKRGENIAGMSFASVRIVHQDTSKINDLRRSFAVGLQNSLPEPMASFALGILIGQRNTLPESLKEQLTKVGLIHIVAVSGYNLTIIINFSKKSFAKRSRYQALAISLGLILVFLLLTGSSPSIVRAAVVSSIGLCMWYFGRDIKPVLLLLLAAALTAGFNPLYLWSSIGWYLSFTAFFGVLVLAPLLRQRFLPNKTQEKMLPQILSETIAAQLCTLPIILFVFGRLSVVSIFANVMVVPFIPFAMLASLIAGVYGMIGPFAYGGVIILPARILLGYIVSASEILSRIPYANVSFTVSVIQMSMLYILLTVFSAGLYASQRRKLIYRRQNMV